MQRWPRRTLPMNLNPVGTRCIQIKIPDDDDWERAMYAEVVTLAQWMRWERDLGKNGKPVADIWLKALKTWKHCDGSPSPINGMEVEEEMPLRIDCDCNVFVTCCDGTEKQILTSDQVAAAIAGQPGSGTPIPQAGQCTTWPATIGANGVWLVPTLVNAGDVLTCSKFNGATTAAAPLGRWNCEDGQIFQLGGCQGNQTHDSSDLEPSLFYGQLMWVLNGSYFSALTPFTVPSGNVNQQIALVINYPPGSNFAGSLTCNVQLCNNQAGTFRHVFDFTLTPATFQPYTDSLFTTPIGQWTSGIGWTDTEQFESPYTYRAAAANRAMDSRTLTRVTMTFDLVPGHNDSGHSPGIFTLLNGTPIAEIFWDDEVSGTGQTLDWVGTMASVTQLGIFVGAGNQTGATDPGGAAVITQLVVEGIGTDPF